MRILYYECKKILTNKMILLFLLLAIICNITFLGFELYQKERIANPFIDATQTIAQQEEQLQKEAIEAYPGMINAIIEEATKASKSTLFSTTRSYTQANLLHKVKLYHAFDDVVLSYQNRVGISYLLNTPITKILSMLIVIMICLFVFAQEFEEGHMQYLRPLKNARNKLILSKLVAVMFMSVSATVLLYMSSAGFLSILYMDMWTNGRIQEMLGMLRSTWNISILQYALLYICLFKFAIAICISIVSFICNLCKNTMYSIFIIILLILIETACYLYISENSYLAIFHFINIISLFDISIFFHDYFTLNIFGQPISMFVFALVIWTCIACICLFGSIKAFHTTKNWNAFYKLHLHKKNKLHSLSYYEAYKFLFLKKAIFIFFIFTAFQIYMYKDYQVYESPDIFYYRVYSKYLSGPLQADKELYLKDEEQKLNTHKDELRKLSSDYEQSKISVMDYEQKSGIIQNKLLPEQGFMKAKLQYLALKDTHKAVYIDETPYLRILGKEAYDGYYLQFIKIILVLALCLAGIMALEYETKMNVRIHTMPSRFKKINQRKYVYAFLFATSVYLISVLSDFFVKYIVGGGNHITASISNLLFLNIDFPIPIWMFIIIVILIGLLFMFGITCCILFLSKKTKKTSTAMIYAMLLLVLNIISTIIKR